MNILLRNVNAIEQSRTEYPIAALRLVFAIRLILVNREYFNIPE